MLLVGYLGEKIEASHGRECVGTGALACAGELNSPVLMEARAPTFAHIG